MRYIILVFLLFFASLSRADEAFWLLVDTQKKVIQVRWGERVLDRFEGISIGRNGAQYKQKSGDNITPLGNYKIAYINDKGDGKK